MNIMSKGRQSSIIEIFTGRKRPTRAQRSIRTPSQREFGWAAANRKASIFSGSSP
jgi:hypothetical protein